MSRIPDFGHAAAEAARHYQGCLTKPAGSLGRLEELAIWFCGALDLFPAPEMAPAVAVFAGDHGIVEEGISAYPASVTPAMVANMLAGGAAINQVARELRAPMMVVDVGVASEIPPASLAPSVEFLSRRVRSGTASFLKGAALDRSEVESALKVGAAAANQLIDRGANLLILGEMGIGNTTAAAALVAVYTARSASETVGRGTGVDDEALRRKQSVVAAGLDLHRPDPTDPIGVLAAFGGLEQAAMAGAMLEAAGRRVPVLLDGYLANAAALVARAIEPAVLPYLAAGHESAEPGARLALEALGLQPILRLEMRLGEGSGAAIAALILKAALALQNGMATFDSANVDGPHG